MRYTNGNYKSYGKNFSKFRACRVISVYWGKHQGLFKQSSGLEAKFTISQSISQLNQVVSVWEYKDEDHMNEVRKFLSAQSRLPNSLAPKEIAYETKVIHSS